MFINKSYSPPFIRQSLKCNTKFFNVFLAVQIIILLLSFTLHYGHMVAITYQFNLTTVLFQNNRRKKITRPHKTAHCWWIHSLKQLHSYLIYSYIHSSILTTSFKTMIKTSRCISLTVGLRKENCLLSSLKALPFHFACWKETKVLRRQGEEVSSQPLFPVAWYYLQVKSKIQGSFLTEKQQLLVAVCSVRHFTKSSQEIAKDW